MEKNSNCQIAFQKWAFRKLKLLACQLLPLGPLVLPPQQSRFCSWYRFLANRLVWRPPLCANGSLYFKGRFLFHEMQGSLPTIYIWHSFDPLSIPPLSTYLLGSVCSYKINPCELRWRHLPFCCLLSGDLICILGLVSISDLCDSLHIKTFGFMPIESWISVCLAQDILFPRISSFLRSYSLVNLGYTLMQQRCVIQKVFINQNTHVENVAFWNSKWWGKNFKPPIFLWSTNCTDWVCSQTSVKLCLLLCGS